MTLRLLAGLVAVALVAACATLSEEECIEGNWREIGQRDGQAGRTASFLTEHAKACEKIGILPANRSGNRGGRPGCPLIVPLQKPMTKGARGVVCRQSVLRRNCPRCNWPMARAWHGIVSAMRSMFWIVKCPTCTPRSSKKATRKSGLYRNV